MAGEPWTDQEAESLRAMVADGRTDAYIARRLEGRTRDAVRMKRTAMDLPSGAAVGRGDATLTRVVSETDDRTVIAPEESADEDIDNLWARSIRATNATMAKATTENLALARIVSDKPIALSVSSDHHITSRGAVDLEGMREYAIAIREASGAYAVAVGDLVDNRIKWAKDMPDVPDAWRLAADWLRMMGPKMLGTTSGNHDDWSKAFAGIDYLRDIAERNKVHFASDELVWIIELVDPATMETSQRYVIATRHKYYRHSNLNPSHACFRWLEDRTGEWPLTEDGGEMVPDVLAIGHNHVAVVEARTMKNKTIWGARMGAWQYTSGYGRAGGWKHSPPTAPTFILHPDRHEVEGHEDYRRALRVLGSLREGRQKAA